jgi:two-component sensor histidine kinase
MLDTETQELVLIATRNFKTDMTEHFHRVDASSNTSCGRALARGERVFVDFDMPASEDLDGSLRMHVEAGYLSAQSTPLIARSGQPIGMLSTHWHNHHRSSERDLRFLDLLVRQAADLIEHKQAEAALRLHQAEIEALNTRLRRAMQERHHRIKNNLQVIAAIVEMESYDRSGVSDKALRRINTHVRALATIHDLLTHQAKGDADMTDLNAAAMLDRLIAMLRSVTEGRRILCTTEPVLLPIQQSAALALLVNELVSNAIKHSDGNIEITLQMDEQTDGRNRKTRHAILTVSDDGAGFPEGFDPQTVANTGMELIDSTARWDLRGEVSYENRPEGGARVTVTFPVTLE